MEGMKQGLDRRAKTKEVALGIFIVMVINMFCICIFKLQNKEQNEKLLKAEVDQ
jgi:hypothetical protein